MVISLRHLICLVLTVCAVLPARPEATPKSKVSVKFNVFALPPLAGVGYHPLADRPLEALTFYSAARSPVYRYVGEANLRFYEMSGSATPAPVAVWEVPLQMQNALLLFFRWQFLARVGPNTLSWLSMTVRRAFPLGIFPF